MTSPYIKIWKTSNSDYPIIDAASIKRDFLDKTFNKIGYSCAPLTLANQHGWWFTLPQDVVVIWDGLREGIDGEDGGHVRIVEGEYYNGLRIVTNESGVGQVTFLFHCTIETDPDHYLIFSGPPNYFHDDAKPLEAVWRSDFFNYESVSFNWIPTTKNKEIVFPKGMPVLFIKNYPKGLIDDTEVIVDQMENSQPLKNDFKRYIAQRNEWFADKGPYDFRNFYRKGIGPDYRKVTEKPLKISHKKIKRDLDT